MTYKERVYQQEMVATAKAIILEDMMIGVLKGRDYSDLDIDERLKLLKILSERGQLTNRCST